jgi:signal transduction histidine kinase
MTEIEAHRHRYRSPIAAIIGLAESALRRDDLDPALVKQLKAIRSLAQEALEADEEESKQRVRAENSIGALDPDGVPLALPGQTLGSPAD